MIELDAIVAENLVKLLLCDRHLAIAIHGERLDHLFDRLTLVHLTSLLDVVHHIVVELLESLLVQVVHKLVDMCWRYIVHLHSIVESAVNLVEELTDLDALRVPFLLEVQWSNCVFKLSEGASVILVGGKIVPNQLTFDEACLLKISDNLVVDLRVKAHRLLQVGVGLGSSSTQ